MSKNEEEKKEEIWKIIPNFSKYEISSLGRLKNKKYQRLLSLNIFQLGYIKTMIYNDNNERKSMFLHRLVAITFIPNPKNKFTVNHKDHNKLNNCVENLEWATTTEQNIHKKKSSIPKKGRTVWRIDPITNKRLEKYESMKLVGKWVFDNNLTTRKNWETISSRISQVCGKVEEIDKKGRKTIRKKAYGYKWKYDTSDENIYEYEIWKEIPQKFLIGPNINNYKYWISDMARIKNNKGRIVNGLTKIIKKMIIYGLIFLVNNTNYID